tara:strand:+ start:722 stop:1087 length:366 start_codon:yes stop_codon:yes gene_type:complete
MAEEYKVSLSYDNAINVSLDSQLNNKVDSNFDISTTQLVAQTVEDLGNVDTSALDKQGTTTDKYVLVWDASQQKYAFVNPDAVLSAAADSTTTIQPGLPQDFIDKLDDDLDNLIDVDAGSF